MGKRGEPRKEVQVPVRIFGTDHTGSVFSQKAVTVNISRNGVELAGVESTLADDEIIGLTYGPNRAISASNGSVRRARQKLATWGS